MNLVRALANLLQFNRANWKAVILCFIAAAVFWLFNAFNKNHTSTVRFPIHFEYNEDEFTYVNPLPNYIDINVTGNGWDLFRNLFGLKVPTLTVPVERPMEVKKITGTTLLPLFQPQIGKLLINFLVTDTLRVQFDEKDFHKFKVVPVFTDFSFKDGYGRISPVVVLPDSITLEGSKVLLHHMPDSISISIKGDRVDQNFNEEVEVLVTEETIQRNPPHVKVLFEVGVVIEKREQLKLVGRIDRLDLPDSVAAWFRIPIKREEDFRSLSKEMTATVNTQKLQQFGIAIPKVNRLPSYAQLIRIDTLEFKPVVK